VTQYYNNTSVPLTAAITTITVATGRSRGKTKVNLTVANNAAGASSTVYITSLSQNGQVVDQVAPGSVLSSQDVEVDDLQISASGSATVAVDMRYPAVLPPNNLTVTGIVTASITGKVSTSIDGQTVGVAPATSLAGAAIDPRNVDLVTDSVGLAKTGQLPAVLDASGGLKTDAGQDTIVPSTDSPTGKALAVKTEAA
jgi:hypothetical protein